MATFRRPPPGCSRATKAEKQPPDKQNYIRNNHNANFSSFTTNLVLLLLSLLLLLLLSPEPVTSLDFPPQQQQQQQQQLQLQQKNSGHYQISQLCLTRSQFPTTKRVEGAVLSSQADKDINCTITFRTKSSQQHFVVRFEELRLGCDDHLKMFDGDLDYGQPSIHDYSCRDNMAGANFFRTTGSFLTIRYSTDSKTLDTDGFRLVLTAVFDQNTWECPAEYALCSNRLCISRALFCDEVNHCLDNSDESSCQSRGLSGSGGSGGNLSLLAGGGGDLSLTNALGLLVVLVLVIFTCVILFISAIYCRRENHYAQYQHQLHRAATGATAAGFMPASSSLMFAHHPHQPPYHYFQAAHLSPYVTPQHQHQPPPQLAMTTTLPRGYSTLPLNLARGQPPPMKANNQPTEYLMMAGLAGGGHQPQTMQRLQTSLYLPTSQSILATTAPTQQQQQQQQPPPQ